MMQIRKLSNVHSWKGGCGKTGKLFVTGVSPYGEMHTMVRGNLHVGSNSHLGINRPIDPQEECVPSSPECRDTQHSNTTHVKDETFLWEKLRSSKVFSVYTKSYIHKESEQKLVLSLHKLNEYKKVKGNVKLSIYIYELQNLSKSKIGYNVLKKIDIVNSLFEHINDNIYNTSPALLLSVAMSYKNVKLNRYTYFKNVLRGICNNIKVYKNIKMSRLLLKGEDENKDKYEHTIELLKKQKKRKCKINMLNVYSNHLNNSALCYILYSYSSLFSNANAYILYICKYILLNVGSLNQLDMLSLLHFMRRSSVKLDRRFLLSHKEHPRRHPERHQERLQERLQEHHPEKSSALPSTHLPTKSNQDEKGALANTYLKILRTIIYLLSRRRGGYENANISILILHSYYKMGLIPIQIFYKMHYRIEKKIKCIDVKYVSLYLYVLSGIKFRISYYKFIYSHLATVFEKKTKQFDLLSLCLSFYSLSKNGYYYAPFVRCVLFLLKEHAYNLNDVQLTNVVYTLGKLKVRDDELCNKLCDVLKSRMENISGINLSLIVHNFSKISYKNEEFFKLCLDKGKELLSCFTAKQLVMFTDGIVINNMYDYEFMELFFTQLIRIDCDNVNVKRKNAMSKICFSVVLERGDFIKRFPPSINMFISKNMGYTQEKIFTQMHNEIANILSILNVEKFEVLKRKKPYVFDIYIKGDKDIYIDILSDRKFLTCSENFCGFIELKKRHMKLLNARYYYFRKGEYLSMDTLDKKINFVKAFLEDMCLFDFNNVNREEDEQKKGEIKELLRFGIIEKGETLAGASSLQGGSLPKRDITNPARLEKERERNPIGSRDYYLLPTSIKIEKKIAKILYKKNKKKVSYVEPLGKKRQIFIDYDQGILLNREKISFFQHSVNNSGISEEGGRNPLFMGGDNLDGNTLFGKKCHGLSKFEALDPRTGKIDIKRRGPKSAPSWGHNM
ncbi:conserved Plasmodium protein, unknown function [Plasmodium ovale wallikeri]|uniref:Uncharacterized protein n=1 Tax=Plasmodium ovale wallikeri TaxID=864142 RepID=A0A1A8Z568_PLAOA|nr:conserved Plasmodium protein, unknown function [Plasmodium ovale wallikeri]SBT38949.1 conserved Plasmodium protein, unknown function [Plasmodium ovale wallikeri]